MRFYREQGVPGLEDSEPTEKFIMRIHNLADAMNSNRPRGALWAGSTQEQVSKNHNTVVLSHVLRVHVTDTHLTYLGPEPQAIKDYEEYHKQCIALAKSLGKKSFWSEKTDLGLTVTLRSTLELTDYLRRELAFVYIMTQHFNSDIVEVKL